jgi:1,4-dihydroxy-2-naphthoate octaprenyltransferase
MNKSPSTFSILVRYARPAMLVAGVLFYLLGAGMARYLGHPILWARFWVGLAAVILLQLTSYFLKAYYDMVDATSPLRRMQKDEEDEDQKAASKLPQQGVLMVGTTSMTAGAVLAVLMFTMGAVNLTLFLFLGIAFLLSFFYAVPPLRLVYSGYGELVESIVMANLFPALAFILQTGELHRYLAMLTFPLLAFFLAVRLVLSLEKYAQYLKYGYKTMMVVLGWQRGMRIHNLLIPAGYLLIAMAFTLGLPWSLTWPALLTVPIGLFEIIQINQISNGAPPNWRLLNLTAVALIGMAVYLMSLALWTG